jgi:hypothetical protein
MQNEYSTVWSVQVAKAVVDWAATFAFLVAKPVVIF